MPVSNFRAALLAVTILAATFAPASGHMIMAKPVPYGKETNNNSPLSPSGSDYPCKQRPGVYTVSEIANYTAGGTGTLALSGSAVHAGGSCQISISLDKEPTKDSIFKVIHSIEGGCPAVGKEYTFPIPKSIPNGEMTFSWSWANRLGVREQYQQCGRISVSNGAQDTKEFEKLPDMALANLASLTTCKTVEGFDYEYENPGESVEKLGTGPYMPLCGGPSSPAPGNPGTPSQQPNNPGIPSQTAKPVIPSSSSPASSAPASSAPASSKAPTTPQPQKPKVTSTATTLVTVTGTPPGPASSKAPATPSQAPQQSSAPAPDGKCTDGQLLCNGPSKFGLCDHGKVVWQDVAPGTKCENGVIGLA